MTPKTFRLLAGLAAAAAPAALLAQASQPWLDRSRPAAERADALIRAMTLDEKLQYVHGLFPPRAQPAPADMLQSAGYVPGVPRLGIPTLRESDASLGVANQVEQRKGDTATALPAGLAIAAGFDPDLAFEGGRMIGAEARAKTFNVLLAGGINLTRDAWNGRNFEYMGEDPLLAGRLGGAAIRGVQTNHIVSTVKHFVLNAQETGRMLADARIDEAALRESDLLAFQIAIKEGKPGSVMCAYNLLYGDHACESAFLMNKVLRDDWHYSGFTMSDWGGVHSTEKAALSGLDQESGQELDSQIFFGKPLRDAVAAGRVPQTRLDAMVRNILTGVIETGLYDDPTPTSYQPIDFAAHADVAQRIAEAGIVVLKNERGLLPLARTAKRIVLIGGHADVGVLSGGGSSQVRSVGGVPVEIPLTSGAAASFARVTYHSSSPLKALRGAAPKTDVVYVDGSDPAAAAAAARSADLAIVFATQWQTEAQDAPNLSLPDGQDQLIESVAGANRKTVVVLETGGPVLMPWIDRVPALVQAWYPGQRGGEALARVLYGDVDASGRLPISFMRSVSQLPRPEPVTGSDDTLHNAASNAGDGDGSALKPFVVNYGEGADVGYRWYSARGDKPLFPFGYGLSYAEIAYGKPSYDTAANAVTVEVRNDSDRAGVAVPQVYVTPQGQQPRLAGWKRLSLQPHTRTTVAIPIDFQTLARWNGAGFTVPAGDYGWSLSTDAETTIGAGFATLPERRLSAAGELANAAN